MDAIITAPNKSPAKANESVIRIAMTAEILAVKKENTALVTLPSSSDRVNKLPFGTNNDRTFFNLTSNKSGNEKLEYPRINSPLQFTKDSKNAALYVNATNIQGSTFDKRKAGIVATPASFTSVSFAKRQYTGTDATVDKPNVPIQNKSIMDGRPPAPPWTLPLSKINDNKLVSSPPSINPLRTALATGAPKHPTIVYKTPIATQAIPKAL
mmetsp:Transcript_9938/g.14216  ORF Transcript_9938/g.14216 Transcript_9938/m.14216 type:complete len:211 (+) Transcript_9938:271-903(+)